jgi:hypothetical protein
MAKAKPKSKSRRLSRHLLDDLLRDLAGRLGKLEHEAEAFDTIIKPNGEHTVIEHKTRTACGVLLDSLQHRIRDARALTDIMVRQ